MAIVNWTTIAESHEYIVRVASGPTVTLFTTRPRALPPNLAGLFRDACARFAPHVTFEPAAAAGRDRVRGVARVGNERVEVGVVARDLLCLSYLLASRPDAVPDPRDLIERDLAGATSPFAHWLD